MKQIFYTILLLAGVFFSTPSLLWAFPVQDPPEFGDQHQDRKTRYFAERLEFIAKFAGLTDEEKEIVKSELLKYDNNRLDLYREERKFRQALTRSGLTEKEYADFLTQALKADSDRAGEMTDLFERLSAKLSPEKAAKVFLGLRSYNTRVAKKLRDTKK